jgi:hypothetical protein
MGSRNWTLKRDADIHIRIPDQIKLALEVMAHQERVTLSHIVTQILANDPSVLEMQAAIANLVLVEDSTGEVISP